MVLRGLTVGLGDVTALARVCLTPEDAADIQVGWGTGVQGWARRFP